MNRWDAVIWANKLGCCLLTLAVLMMLPPRALAAEKGRDPFSDTRTADSQDEYPSVLTMPNFEASVTSNVPSTPVTSTVKPITSLKTPVVPVATTGIPVNKGYVSPTTTYYSHPMILRENVLLSQGINEWAKEAGYKLLWNSTRDYLIYSTITFSGSTQDDVLGDLGKLFASENYGLVIKLYEKNRVLLVDEQ